MRVGIATPLYGKKRPSMCYVQNCQTPNELDSYFVAGSCITHFNILKTDLATKFPDLKSNADLCNDVALAYVLMSDEAAVLALLDDLNDWLAAVDPENVRLTAALEYWELVCWFPRVRIMPAGILSTDEFLNLIAHGCVLKDVGAGAPHGRLTHRLQWHALMSAMTNKFHDAFAAPWTMSPLKLYCSLGGKGTVSGPSSVWGQVFDMGGSAPHLHFRAPDRLHTVILQSSKLSLRVNLARKRNEDARNLSSAVRKHLLEADKGSGPFASWVEKGKGAPLILAHQQAFGLGRAFTFEDLYDFIDKKIFNQQTLQNYPRAYLYIVKSGTSVATKHFLEKRNLPTNLNVMAKPNFYAPDTATLNKRITESLKDLNYNEANAIYQDCNFDKRYK